MNGQRQTLLAIGGALLLVAGVAADQAKPAAPVTPRPATQRPNDEATAPKTPTKLVAPFRGEAEIYYTKPVQKVVGNMVITTIRVQNAANAPLAGLKVDEFWYDKAGNPVTGSKTFRTAKPLQPGEVIEVKLEVPKHPAMERNQYKFEHANGKIKPTQKAKL